MATDFDVPADCDCENNMYSLKGLCECEIGCECECDICDCPNKIDMWSVDMCSCGGSNCSCKEGSDGS